jgi:hypothetical protein
MNFRDFQSVQEHSDLLYVSHNLTPVKFSTHYSGYSFWIIGIPIFAVVLVAALYSEIKKLWGYIQRRAAIKNMLGI